jgi:DNA-binding XRE family transcriptional regulator
MCFPGSGHGRESIAMSMAWPCLPAVIKQRLGGQGGPDRDREGWVSRSGVPLERCVNATSTPVFYQIAHLCRALLFREWLSCPMGYFIAIRKVCTMTAQEYRAALFQLRMTQGEAAERLGVTRRTSNNYANGRTRIRKDTASLVRMWIIAGRVSSSSASPTPTPVVP